MYKKGKKLLPTPWPEYVQWYQCSTCFQGQLCWWWINDHDGTIEIQWLVYIVTWWQLELTKGMSLWCCMQPFVVTWLEFHVTRRNLEEILHISYVDDVGRSWERVQIFILLLLYQVMLYYQLLERPVWCKLFINLSVHCGFAHLSIHMICDQRFSYLNL